MFIIEGLGLIIEGLATNAQAFISKINPTVILYNTLYNTMHNTMHIILLRCKANNELLMDYFKKFY